MNQDKRRRGIERTIQEAMDAGLFDDLQGVGRPINWADESMVDEDWVMAFRIMREGGFGPAWIELHKEIKAELGKARQAVLGSWRWRQERLGGSVRESERRYVEAEWRRARTVFAEALAELNSKIADFNLMVPVTRLHKFKLDVAQELAGMGIEG